MLESSDKQIDTIIGEIFGYIDMYDSLLANTKIADDNISARREFLDSILKDLYTSRHSTFDNSLIFILCVTSLRAMEFLKTLGIIERWVDSFQAAILELSMLSNMDESNKNLIQQVYFLRII